MYLYSFRDRMNKNLLYTKIQYNFCQDLKLFESEVGFPVPRVITIGNRLHHISTPAGIAALVVTNAFDVNKKDIYYLYNDYQGSLIAVLKLLIIITLFKLNHGM
jgi:hypothetical protein